MGHYQWSIIQIPQSKTGYPTRAIHHHSVIVAFFAIFLPVDDKALYFQTENHQHGIIFQDSIVER